MSLNKTTAARLAGAWGRFYHAALTRDHANIVAFGAELKRAQIETGITMWDDEMIDLKILELGQGASTTDAEQTRRIAENERAQRANAVDSGNSDHYY